MSVGKGRTFLKGWLRGILDGNLTPAQKTFNIFCADFKWAFHLFNITEKAWIDMGNLKQDKEDAEDGYEMLISEFQLVAAKCYAGR